MDQVKNELLVEVDRIFRFKRKGKKLSIIYPSDPTPSHCCLSQQISTFQQILLFCTQRKGKFENNDIMIIYLSRILLDLLTKSDIFNSFLMLKFSFH